MRDCLTGAEIPSPDARTQAPTISEYLGHFQTMHGSAVAWGADFFSANRLI